MRLMHTRVCVHISAVFIRAALPATIGRRCLAWREKWWYQDIVPCAGCKACNKPFVAVFRVLSIIQHSRTVHRYMYLAYETRLLCLYIHPLHLPTHTHPADHLRLLLVSLTLTLTNQARTQSHHPLSASSSSSPRPQYPAISAIHRQSVSVLVSRSPAICPSTAVFPSFPPAAHEKSVSGSTG